MGIATHKNQLLRYKLRTVGLRHTLWVAYLDWTDSLQYHLHKRFPKLPFSPRSVQIECTTRCNLKCTMCEISYWTEKPADLQFENIQQMVAHLPRLKRVDLTGIGEALMNPKFMEIVQFLKGQGIYVTLNDNFTLMTELTARRLVELEVDQIFVSLDGATQETYEQIRRGAKFETVIANVQRLLAIKEQLSKKLPEVKINCVVTLSNYPELPDLIELAHTLGIGMVQFVNVITFEDTAQLGTQDLQRVQGIFQKTVARAQALGVLVKIELFDKLPVQQCDFPWTRNFVTYDGYVHPCCYTTQNGDRTAQNQRSLGNLIEHSFADLWCGPEYVAFREKMKQGILPYQCKNCPKYDGKTDLQSGHYHPQSAQAR